jgi:uncharacterized lipoprotein YajG
MQNEERINGLETQVRTLKRIVYGFGCVLLAGIVVGATSLQNVPDVIQAKKFEVVNDEGKVVASFYANMGGGMLSVSNKDGEVVVGLGSDEVNGGGVLGINNKDGKIVAGIFANENGGVARVLNNKFTEVVRIDVDNNGYGEIKVTNSEGEDVSEAPSEESCCQHPHHLECIVNTTSASPGDCQHSHHLEGCVTTIK